MIFSNSDKKLIILVSGLFIFMSGCLTTSSKRRTDITSQDLTETEGQELSTPGLLKKFDLTSGLDSSGQIVKENFKKLGLALNAMGLDNSLPIALPASLFQKALVHYHVESFNPESPTGIASMALLRKWARSGATFNSMLDTIIYAGAHRQQPFVNFLDKARTQGWLSEIRPEYIQIACVSMMVLEVLTIAANNSNLFGKELLKQYYTELKSRGVDSSELYKTLWKLKSKIGLFPAVKFLSITPGVIASTAKGLNGGQMFENKEELDRLLKKYDFQPLNSMEIANSLTKNEPEGSENIGFRMNVAEATIVDAGRKLYNNSLTGSKLMIWTETHRTKGDWHEGSALPDVFSTDLWDDIYSQMDLDSISKDENRRNFYDRTFFSKEMIAAYTSWNAAFVLTEFGPENLDNFVWLWVKLILPSTFGASPEDYLSTRKWSLWLAGTAFLMNWLDQLEEYGPENFPRTPEPLAKKFKIISEEWGKINHIYADNTLDECNNFADGDALRWYWDWIDEIGTTELIFDYVVLRDYPAIIPKNKSREILEMNKKCLKNSPTMNF